MSLFSVADKHWNILGTFFEKNIQTHNLQGFTWNIKQPLNDQPTFATFTTLIENNYAYHPETTEPIIVLYENMKQTNNSIEVNHIDLYDDPFLNKTETYQNSYSIPRQSEYFFR